MIKIKIIFLLGFVSLSCSDSLTNYHAIPLDKEFNLGVGESAIISQHGVVIKFKTVEEDSRCPIPLACFVAGNAVVVLELKDSDRNKQTIKLNTYLEPKNVEYSNLIIDLKDLTPYPKSDEIIDPDDYVAKLIVKKKEN